VVSSDSITSTAPAAAGVTPCAAGVTSGPTPAAVTPSPPPTPAPASAKGGGGGGGSLGLTTLFLLGLSCLVRAGRSRSVRISRCNC
jgi:hypothetical protein